MTARGDSIEDHRVAAGPDLLSQIVRSGPAMSRGERRVADLVRADPEFAVHSHTRDIAARAGVSTARNGDAVNEIVSLIHRSLEALVEQISEETLKRAASAIAAPLACSSSAAAAGPRWRRWRRRTACSGSGFARPTATTPSSN